LLSGYKILVAEDNPLNQKIAVFLLTKHGADVTTVTNGQEAVKCVENEDFDIVLMDLQMPEMDGFEAAGVIRNTLKKDMPILALSAASYEDEIEKCTLVGMNGCITKPLDADRLYAIIVELANQKQASA